MNREIKFRGRTEQGKWLYGDLVRSEQGKVAIVPPLSHSMDNDFSQYEVCGSTVGQYTGIKDVNDTPIYEHDILRYQDDRIGSVEWKEFLAGFHSNDFRMIQTDTEIIGNIFDNPRLAKMV